MHGCIYLLMLKTKFCWLSVGFLLWSSLMLLRAESRSAGRVTSEVLDNTFLCCLFKAVLLGGVCLFVFSEFSSNAENTWTH